MSGESLILACPACGAKNRVPVSRIDDAPKCGKCKKILPVQLLGQPINVTDQSFDSDVFGSSLPVLVDCWAPWCGPCKAFGPVLDDLAIQYKGRLRIAKVNLDDNPGIGSKYDITSVPTILFVKDGRVIDRLVGAPSKEQLIMQIARIL